MITSSEIITFFKKLEEEYSFVLEKEYLNKRELVKKLVKRKMHGGICYKIANSYINDEDREEILFILNFYKDISELWYPIAASADSWNTTEEILEKCIKPRLTDLKKIIAELEQMDFKKIIAELKQN